MIFAYANDLIGCMEIKLVEDVLDDLLSLKCNLDSLDPSMESLMRLFLEPSAALKVQVQTYMLKRPRYPYTIPKQCLEGYFELESVITALSAWRHDKILVEQGCLGCAQQRGSLQELLKAKDRQIAALERIIRAKDEIIMQRCALPGDA